MEYGLLLGMSYTVRSSLGYNIQYVPLLGMSYKVWSPGSSCSPVLIWAQHGVKISPGHTMACGSSLDMSYRVWASPGQSFSPFCVWLLSIILMLLRPWQGGHEIEGMVGGGGSQRKGKERQT